MINTRSLEKRGNVNREILRLAIPNIISNITVPLLGIIDLALMGHMGSEQHIGAIALGTMIFNVLYWAFAFLRMGTTGFTAQAFGEKNENEQALNLFRSILTAILAGLLLIILQIPIEWLSFKLIGGGQQVEAFARQYFYIRIWAAPATISLFAFNGWYIGMQNAKIPMWIAIAINIANIAFNFLFVILFGMKSEGVALGTLLAQYTGFLLALYFVLKKYAWIFKHFIWKQILQLEQLHRFFKVNADIMIRTFCIIGVFTFFTSKSAAIDDSVLAINSLLLQFLFFFSYFIDGFAYAGEALVGRYIGEANRTLFRSVVKKLFVWGFGLGIAFTIIYYFAGTSLLSLLTNKKELITQSQDYIGWVVLIPLLSVASFVWDGVYIGATASKAMRNTMLAATFLVFIPSYILTVNHLQNHSIWLAMVLFMFGRGLFQTIIAKRAVGSIQK